MITTITLNPAIDTAYTLAEFHEDKINRVQHKCQHAGGKGINISRMLQAFGDDTACLGFAGGFHGELLKSLLRADHVPFDFLDVTGDTRENITLMAQEKTIKINDTGSPISAADFDTLCRMVVSYAAKSHFVILSGKNPPNVTEAQVITLLRGAGEVGANIVCDSESLCLETLYEIKPALIKPNIDEFTALTGATDENRILACCREMIGRGIGRVIVSMGEDGLIGVEPSCAYRVSVPRVTPVSTVGAGDAVVTGCVRALSKGDAFADALRQGAAFGTAMALTPGTQVPSSAAVKDMFEKTHVTRL